MKCSFGFATVGMLLLGGCSTLPSSGPTGVGVLRSAEHSPDGYGFTVRDLDAKTAAELDDTALLERQAFKPLSGLVGGNPTDRVGPGDVLDVRIYEVGVSLFAGSASNAEASTPAARAENFSALVVDRNGMIRLPYAGAIHVQGMTPAQIGQAIGQRLRSKSQSPQAIIKIVSNLTNAVYLSGAVRKPGKYDLAPSQTRLLDVIAQGGGADSQPEDIVIALTRQGQTLEQRLNTIVAGTGDDIELQAGDRIQLYNRARTFTIFGAAGRVSQIPFEAHEPTLAEAIARASGPNDALADPTSIFLFRQVDDAQNPGRPQRVIYRLNLMEPTGYFVAQSFRMRDKDLIYVANARSNQATKFIGMLSQFFSPAIAVRAIAQ